MSTAFLKIWSDVEYVYRCLADRERTLAFQTAIRDVVKPGQVVIDLGTGSGIMALFAAKAGARRVYAVEIAEYLSKVSQKIFAENGFGETILLLHMDAREVTLAQIEKPDVVICENITTGLIGEPQALVINALKKSGVIDSCTKLIPAEISTNVCLVQVDWTFFDLQLRFPIFVDYYTKSFEKRYERLSAEKIGFSVNFSSEFSEEVNIKESLQVSQSGDANGLLLTSTTNFLGGTKLGSCVSYCQPIILPFEDVKVSKGETVEIAVSYRMGGGFDSLEYAFHVIH